jgi:hypothetical protein
MKRLAYFYVIILALLVASFYPFVVLSKANTAGKQLYLVLQITVLRC